MFKFSIFNHGFQFCFSFFVLLFTVNIAAAQDIAVKIPSKEPLPSDAQVEQNTLKQISDRTSLVLSLDARYTYSDEVDGDSLSGGGLNGLLGLGVKLTNKSSFLLLYNGIYNKTLEFYSDLVGPLRRNEYQSHNISPMLKFDFGANNRYSLLPSIFYTATYNKDVEGGGWDDGLYNYKDKGLGLDFNAKEMGYGGKEGELKLGLQYYDREYPNYTSLQDLVTGPGTETAENDYNGILGRIGYRLGFNDQFSWSIDYYMLYKDYDESKVVGSNGVLTGDGREDYNNNLDLGFWFVPDTQPGLRLGIYLNGNWYRSNQNYYDGMGTILPTDDLFIPDYFDFDSYGIRPSISYLLPMMPLTATLSYAYQKLDYNSRLAQELDGSYKDEKQEETLDIVNLRLFYALAEVLNIASRSQLGIYGRLHYLKMSSNNVSELVYNYNHEVYEFTAGLVFQY